MKKYHVIIIAAPSDYQKDIIADGWDTNSAGVIESALNFVHNIKKNK